MKHLKASLKVSISFTSMSSGTLVFFLAKEK